LLKETDRHNKDTSHQSLYCPLERHDCDDNCSYSRRDGVDGLNHNMDIAVDCASALDLLGCEKDPRYRHNDPNVRPRSAQFAYLLAHWDVEPATS
jgi:hypothetical protein